MAKDTQTNINSVISWIALGLSAVSFVIAVAAFNRSGADLRTVVSSEAEQTAEDVRLAAARAEAEVRLVGLRARVEAQENTEELANEVTDIRANLATAYEGVSGEAQAQLQEFDENLEILEQNLRNSAADALVSLENSISSLRQNVRTDE